MSTLWSDRWAWDGFHEHITETNRWGDTKPVSQADLWQGVQELQQELEVAHETIKNLEDTTND